jgi:hypothetical protein
LIEHVLLFALISLIASLVYHALREDRLARALALGFRRFLSFLVIAAMFGVFLQLFTRWL